MKKYFFMAIAFLAVLSSPVVAHEGLYFKALGGANWTLVGNGPLFGQEFEAGYVVGGAAGYKFCNDISVEIEYAYRNSDVDHDFFVKRVTSQSVMAHALYNLPFCYYGVQPYVGGGIGYTNYDLDFNNDIAFFLERNHYKKNAFSWDAIAGFSYPLCYNLEIDLEGRFFHTNVGNEDAALVASVKYYFNNCNSFNFNFFN